MFTARTELWQYADDELQADLMVDRGTIRTTRSVFIYFALIALAAVITGCGGGGGGGGNSGQPPALGTTSFTIAEDTELSGQITATDPEGGAMTFAKTSDPASGTVSSFTDSSGAFVYRPNADFAGSDSFGVRVTDSSGNAVNGSVTITVTPVNDAPVAVNDVMRAEGSALSTLNVLANDREPDSDAMIVSVEPASTEVGTARENPDNTISITGLPSGFRGVTRFKYRVRDGSNASTIATAAVFVDTDPFRIAFVAQEASDSAEVYMTDLVATWRVSSAKESNWRLRGFVASENGATIAYRRENGTNTDFSFVRTAATDTQVRVSFPSGYTLLAEALPGGGSRDQYTVSPDGQWIAAIASSSTPGAQIGVFVLNVGNPTSLRNVAPTSAVSASQLRFSSDSSNLYFLASDVEGERRRSLYRVALSGTAGPVQLSAAYTNASSTNDTVSGYSVSTDQTRIALHATRNNVVELWYVNPAQPGSELKISHNLGVSEVVAASTLSQAEALQGHPLGRGGAVNGERVAYTTLTVLLPLLTYRTYVAEVGPTPNPRQVGTSDSRAFTAFRPDSASVLFSQNGTEIAEAVIDSGNSPTTVGTGDLALFDATGGAAILRQPAGSSAALASTLRNGSTFTAAQRMGTAGQAARMIDLSGAQRGVAVIGEGATSGTVNSARFVLVNAWAPDKRLPLATFDSPIGLTSDHARIVTY